MDKPLVSVLTITRNRGNLLGRCISSVLSQTYTNIEHIIVDGASDDNTDEVVGGFKDERLRFIKLDYNWPLKKTSDYGVSLCKGKYITFLDSDDEYIPSKIEKQVRLIESLSIDYGFVYCWMTYYDSKKNERIRIHSTQLRGNVEFESISTPCISGTPTLLFRASVLREVGGWKSPEEIGIASDWEMCSRVCQKYKTDFVPESLVNVYINHGMVRQSESASYYQDVYNRTIKFHSYFLNTYSEKFKKRPDLKYYHYWMMCVAGVSAKHRMKAVEFFFKAFASNPRMMTKTILERIKI